MVAILHNLVGLLHANMAVYYAYIDRAPIFIIGATGPMDETKRRPRIDWIHAALVQGKSGRGPLGDAHRHRADHGEEPLGAAHRQLGLPALVTKRFDAAPRETCLRRL